MKKSVFGILAHVDSGKTTLSEAMLYCGGEIRQIGRVDHKNTFLDTDSIERERGITIFSKQAVIEDEEAKITLLDTPGHVDFSSETERALWPLDCAILVISASEGIQSHTETLWNLLSRRGIPVFLFVNKMDIALNSREEIIKSLKARFGEGFVDFTSEQFIEDCAMHSEEIMQKYLDNEEVESELIEREITARKIFPCYFGSALKNDGVESFLKGIKKYLPQSPSGNEFGARVYKITEDEKGNRLTHLKIVGGILKAKDVINDEKVNEIRIYSGEKYKSVAAVQSGDVCSVTGLANTYSGQGLGNEEDAPPLMLEPVFTYRVVIKDDTDVRVALIKLKKLEEEDSQLRVIYNEVLGEIHIQLMGEIQIEVLTRVVRERFDMEIGFEEGSIIYKETIEDIVEGVGHFEPLRHYAEVHLLLEPLKRGSGLVFEADCKDNQLAVNWQRLVLTHLNERVHKGTLTGSAITDMKITLKSGKAHLKHTEGGDFRQATYRAVRNGLRKAQSVLLEPYYNFVLEIPTASTGRAMTDLQQMGASLNAPDTGEETSVITGFVPVRKIRGYYSSVNAYTHGTGKLSCSYRGYDDCVDSQEIIEEIGYDCDADIDNTADSVFCEHGAGFNVRWDKVEEYMHLESILKPQKEEEFTPIIRQKAIVYDEDELIRIFERTYGKIVHKNHNAMRTPKRETPVPKKKATPPKSGDEYLLIDGYNIIFAWDKLKEIAKDSLEDARVKLIENVCAYRVLHPYKIILVFDAYKVKGNHREIDEIDNVMIVYTKEAETADAYIEKTTHELGKKHKVRVATSDGLEQLIILGDGAQRVSASSFIKELEETEKEIEELIKKYGQ